MVRALRWWCVSSCSLTLVCLLYAGYMRALEDAMAIIDKIAFPIDTNNRACSCPGCLS